MKSKSKYHYEPGQFRTTDDLYDHFAKIHKQDKKVEPILLMTNDQKVMDAYQKVIENKWQPKTRY